MNFNDIVEIQNNNFEELKKLETIIKNLENIKEYQKCFFDKVIATGYKVSLTVTTTAGNANITALKETINTQGDSIIEALREIRLYKLGVLNSTLYRLIGKDFQLIFETLESMSDDIHELTSSEYDERSDILLSKIMKDIDTVLFEFRFLNKFNQKIKHINLELANGKDPQKDKLLDIRLLSENNTLDDANIFFENMKKIYENICLLANINNIDQPLKYERIESGTLLTWLNGNKEIIEIIGIILSSAYGVYHYHLSKNSKISDMSKTTELIKDSFELTKELENKGIKVDKTQEDIALINGQIVQSVKKIISNSSNVIINNEKFETDKNMNLLGERLLLEDSLDN